MRSFFKRFKLSQYLLMCQLLTTTITLVLKIIDSPIVDYIGLVWNILNGVAVLIAFVYENAQNVKYYEVTGQFIFNKLGDSFSAFMDFLMSDEYKKVPFEEQSLFQNKLLEIAKNGTYDTRRKISRALPYLYDIEPKMTLNIIRVLREDIYKKNTDIRRRTLEAVLTVIQKGDSRREKQKRYKKLCGFMKYSQYDDSYTIVACIEDYFYAYNYIAENEKERAAVLRLFEALKRDVQQAVSAEVGKIDEGFVDEMDAVWKVLKSLAAISDVGNGDYRVCRDYIEEILEGSQKYPKLTVVKNLYYTCRNYPDCLVNHKCSASSTVYMMDKIHHFLTNALNEDIYLAMPTVRYFDCVCNNIYNSEAKETARRTIRAYFSKENMLINQTAFDKFAKLAATDKDFAKETVSDLLLLMDDCVKRETAEIKSKIESLDAEKQQYYKVAEGRTKFKLQNNFTYKQKEEREHDEALTEIDGMIEEHHERIRFIGKIKKLKEENNL